MPHLHKNVWILTIAQALIMSVNSLGVFVGGLIGSKLAPVEKLATLPVASTVVGTAASVVPVTLLMRRLGRKRSFNLIVIFSIFIAILAAYSVYRESFYLFCFSTLLFGTTSACVMQFRFAAMESVSVELIPKAASSVLLGGIAGAFIGPETAVLGKDILGVEFAGSFLLLGGFFAVGLIVLQFFENPIVESAESKGTARPLPSILKNPKLWVAILSATVGYAIMTFIMTATPVSMHVMDGHSLEDTKWVIQSHIVAMFLPSLITPKVIKHLGIPGTMITGLVAYLICVGVGYSGHQFGYYWISLVLLGIGWNFLFIGGTTLLPQTYQTSERFKVQAVNEFVVFGSQAMASLSAGWFIFTLGWETLLAAVLPIIVFQLLVIWKWGYK